MEIKWTTNLVNLVILGLLPVYIVIHAYLLPDSLSYSGISDPGFISIITLTFLACSLLALLTLMSNIKLKSSRLTIMALAYAIFIYFLREADFHRLFTLEHVTRGKFYTMQSVPLWERIFAALVLLLLALCIVYLLIKYSQKTWKNFRLSEPWAVSVFLWFIVLFISQLSDKSGFNDIHVGRVVEECSECWAAIFIFLAVIQVIPMLFAYEPLPSKTSETK